MISVIGSFFGSSGYANHTKYLVNALAKKVEVSLQTQLIPNWERFVNDVELKSIKTETDYEINLIITHPTFWRTHACAKINYAYLVWEGDKIPGWMVEECFNSNINKIICPSQHTYDAAKNAMTKTEWKIFKNKFVIIPHGVDKEIFYPLPMGGGKKFTILANKGFRNMEDRGGIQYLLKAYLEEFKEIEPVELVLKINPAYGMPDFVQMFPELKGNSPSVTVIPEEYTPQQLNELYNRCDLFASTARAEAFNLPVLEAMACKKPTLVTGYGGHTDFVSNKFTGIHVDYSLSEVHHELEYEGVKWAKPHIKTIRKKLRWFFDNQDKGQKMGSAGLLKAKQYTWDSTAKQIIGLVDGK